MPPAQNPGSFLRTLLWTAPATRPRAVWLCEWSELSTSAGVSAGGVDGAALAPQPRERSRERCTRASHPEAAIGAIVVAPKSP